MVTQKKKMQLDKSLLTYLVDIWIESVQNEQSSQNKPLTSNDTDFGETCYTKVVDNFDTVPSSIYTPSPNK
jgi:hypothetical protein